MPGANELILFDDEDKSLCDKGQLISKQILFQDLLTFSILGAFLLFFGEVTARQFCLEIYWPLTQTGS